MKSLAWQEKSLTFIIICSIALSLVPSCRSQSNSTVLRVKRLTQDTCDNEFVKCTTGSQCISEDNVCDGKIDCTDGSDEFENLCTKFVCPGYLFRCDYGACIGGDKKCNGEKDCKDNSDEVGCTNLPSINTNCRSDEYQCTNGQCLNSDSRCNGVVECDDRSDETEALCLNVYCPGYTYKCAYGACVDGDARCNGVSDCADNSDEKDCPGLPPRPTPTPKPTTGPDVISGQCTGPNQLQNGQWVFFNSNQPGKRGSKIDVNSILKFACDDGFKLSTTDDPQALIACIGPNQWSSDIPTCLKLCPPLYNSGKAILKCVNPKSEKTVECSKATDDVELTYQCETYYEPAYYNKLTCYDGKWDNPTPSCIPVCGEKQVSAATLIVNGLPVKRGHYPWMAAIYSNRESKTFQNICGGSLLKTNIVLTAAHCLTDQQDGSTYEAKYFRVGAGKYYNSYEDERDKDTAQYAEVASIAINEEYRGQLQNFRGDIAILKLKVHFALSKVVQPVCYKNINDFDLAPNTLGVVTGWGYTTSSSTVSDVLKELELPYKDDETCKNEFDRDFSLKYFTIDKICAGYYLNGTGVCKGDSGGALVFRFRDRYYVHGVVSLSPTFYQDLVKHCDIQKSALFTSVKTYSNWLDRKINFFDRGNRRKRYTLSEKSCYNNYYNSTNCFLSPRD